MIADPPLRKPRLFQTGDSRLIADAATAIDDGDQKGAVFLEPRSTHASHAMMRLRRIGWGSLLLSALGGLASIAAGLWVTEFITGLFERSGWLGYVALALAAVASLAAGVIIVREIIGFLRLGRIAAIRLAAQGALDANDKAKADDVTRQLERLFGGRSALRSALRSLTAHRRDILDGDAVLTLAERDLLIPLDREASRIVSRSVRRVALITAVSPSIAVDVAFVVAENLAMIRRLATLYGGRPGLFGSLKLARLVLGHLALTGGVALGDDVIQQLVGHGLTAKISARLGEGIINGAFTGRIGIAAIDLCRPLPFIEAEPARLRHFIAELRRVRGSGSGAGDKSPA